MGSTAQCCGQPFLSKGFPEQSRGSRRPAGRRSSCRSGARVLTDASTCAKHLKEHHGEVTVADSAEFLLAEVLPKLTVVRRIPSVAVHHNCSAQRMKEQAAIMAVARRLRRNGRAARDGVAAAAMPATRACSRPNSTNGRRASSRTIFQPIARSACRRSRPAPPGSASMRAFPSCRWQVCWNTLQGRML